MPLNEKTVPELRRVVRLYQEAFVARLKLQFLRARADVEAQPKPAPEPVSTEVSS